MAKKIKEDSENAVFLPLPGSGTSVTDLGNKCYSKTMIRRVLGIDPGLASTGYGIIEFANNRYRYISHGVIETPANVPHQQRLLEIYNRMIQVLLQYQPTEAGMEALYFAKNVTSAMAVAEARGVLTLCLGQYNIPLGEYSPLTIKQSVVGTSKAGKLQVQEYVKLLLGLETIPQPDHAADALAAAITHIHSVNCTGKTP